MLNDNESQNSASHSLWIKKLNFFVKEQLITCCAWCNRIRDRKGQWHHINRNTLYQQEYDVTHTICLDCKKTVVESLNGSLD